MTSKQKFLTPDLMIGVMCKLILITKKQLGNLMKIDGSTEPNQFNFILHINNHIIYGSKLNNSIKHESI